MSDSEDDQLEQEGKILYCGVCTLPPEYCEYSGTYEQCMAWLKEEEPEVYERIFSADVLAKLTKKLAEATVSESSTASAEGKSDQADGEAEDEKKPKKGGKGKKEKSKPKVQIKSVERNKKKSVTVVSNLELYDIDLKKAAKRFANKFACGASVVKNAPGTGEEIVVQGDVVYDLMELVVDEYEQLTEDDVEVVEK